MTENSSPPSYDDKFTPLELRLITTLENYAYGRKSLTECGRDAHNLLREIGPVIREIGPVRNYNAKLFGKK